MTLKEKMMKMRQGRTPEKVKELAKREGSFTGTKKSRLYVDSVKNVLAANNIKGEFTFRIIPPFFKVDGGHWAYPVSTHYNVGINKDNFNCPKRMIGKKCPICNEVEKLTDPEDRKANKHFYPKDASIVYIIDRASEDKGPILWKMPFGVEKDILTQASRGKIEFVDDVDEGYDITVSYEKVETGAYTGGRWSSVTIDRLSSPLSNNEDLIEEWLEYCDENSLDKVCHFEEYETLLKAINDDGSEEVTSTDDNKTDVKNKLKKFRKI